MTQEGFDQRLFRDGDAFGKECERRVAVAACHHIAGFEMEWTDGGGDSSALFGRSMRLWGPAAVTLIRAAASVAAAYC